MKHTHTSMKALVGLFTLPAVLSLATCTPTPAAEAAAEPNAEEAKLSRAQMVERGKYLVDFGGCHDCHSPKILTPEGPKVDESRILSGSPAGQPLPAIDETEIAPGKWYLGSSDLTAWVGPWGVSYAANLTPDPETGSGNWTPELFIKMLRTGKFMGVDNGRPIMPPMPWEGIRKLTDQDLKCIFAYLQTLPRVSNRVPEYVPPPEIAKLNAAK